MGDTFSFPVDAEISSCGWNSYYVTFPNIFPKQLSKPQIAQNGYSYKELKNYTVIKEAFQTHTFYFPFKMNGKFSIQFFPLLYSSANYAHERVILRSWLIET